ncbi:sensor histidine kinase [Lutibacter sp.]
MKFNLKNISSSVIHILSWGIILLISLITFYNRFNTLPNNNDFIYRMSFNIILFYLNYSLLVPKLLLNKKILLYIIVSFIFIIVSVYISQNIIPLNSLNPNFSQGYEIIGIRDKRIAINTEDKNFKAPIQGLVTFLLFAVSASIKLVLEWYKNEKIKALVETHKITAELSFLKAQLNPHFLFNSLNSIYSLANKKSDSTTDAIITLSELMRYMIYETDKEFVPLQKEIDYIKNYISLQNLRLKDSSGVRFNVHGNLDQKIEPLLLISFIENAFKYGTDYTGKTNITIKIIVEENSLTLKVSNYISLKEKNNPNSGFGIQNIESRLNLLYPKSHVLKIEELDNLYKVELLLKLKNNEVFNNR